jgi:hypothetical protein
VTESGEDAERDPDDDGQDESHDAELDRRPEAVCDDLIDRAVRVPVRRAQVALDELRRPW